METSGHWILVVEDDSEIFFALKELLEEEGYNVIGAANGREALDRLKNGGQTPSVILLDLMMPVMDGWQFRAEQMRTPKLGKIPVVVISAAGDAASTVDADKFLAKPLRIEDILSAVEEYCRPSSRDSSLN